MSGPLVGISQTIEVDTAVFRGLVRDAQKVPLLEAQIEVYEQAKLYADSTIKAQQHTISFLHQAIDNQAQQINLYMANEEDYKKIIRRQNVQKWVDRGISATLLATTIGLAFR